MNSEALLQVPAVARIRSALARPHGPGPDHQVHHRAYQIRISDEGDPAIRHVILNLHSDDGHGVTARLDAAGRRPRLAADAFWIPPLELKLRGGPAVLEPAAIGRALRRARTIDHLLAEADRQREAGGPNALPGYRYVWGDGSSGVIRAGDDFEVFNHWREDPDVGRIARIRVTGRAADQRRLVLDLVMSWGGHRVETVPGSRVL